MKKSERIAQLEAENEELKKKIGILESYLACLKAASPIVIQPGLPPHYDPFPYNPCGPGFTTTGGNYDGWVYTNLSSKIYEN